MAEDKKSLAVVEQLPAYLTVSTDGREQIDQSDLSLPRLLVMNALSDPVKSEIARQGDLVENVTNSVLYDRKAGVPMKGVFIAQRKMRQRWRPKGAGQGIDCYAADGQHATQANGLAKGVATNDCSICEYAMFTKKADGSVQAPACTEYREFLFLADGYPMPLVISLGKSAARQGKKLVEGLSGQMGMTGRPMYAFQFALTTKEEQGGGNKWWAFDLKPAGYPSEELFTKAKSLYDKYKTSLNRQVAVRSDADEAGSSVADASPSIG